MKLALLNTTTYATTYPKINISTGTGFPSLDQTVQLKSKEQAPILPSSSWYVFSGRMDHTPKHHNLQKRHCPVGKTKWHRSWLVWHLDMLQCSYAEASTTQIIWTFIKLVLVVANLLGSHTTFKYDAYLKTHGQFNFLFEFTFNKLNLGVYFTIEARNFYGSLKFVN